MQSAYLLNGAPLIRVPIRRHHRVTHLCERQRATELVGGSRVRQTQPLAPRAPRQRHGALVESRARLIQPSRRDPERRRVRKRRLEHRLVLALLRGVELRLELALQRLEQPRRQPGWIASLEQPQQVRLAHHLRGRARADRAAARHGARHAPRQGNERPARQPRRAQLGGHTPAEDEAAAATATATAAAAAATAAATAAAAAV